MIISAFIFGFIILLVGVVFATVISLIAIAIGVPWTPVTLIVASVLGTIAAVALFEFLGLWYFRRRDEKRARDRWWYGE